MSKKTFEANHKIDLVSKSNDGKTVNYKAIVDTQNDGELEKSFLVNLSPVDLEKLKDLKLAYLASKTKLKGFRPGKAPLNVIWTQHKNELLNEITRESINSSLHAIVTHIDRDLITSPEVDVKKNSLEDGLEFKVTLHLTPIFDLPDVKELSVEKLTYEITDEDVLNKVKDLMAQNKSFQPVEKGYKAENGDKVVIDFEGKMDGVTFNGGSAKGHHLELGSKNFIDNFEDQLLKHEVGDKVLVKVKFPKDYHKAEFSEKLAEFDVTINQILQAKECKTEEELNKSLGFHSIDEMRQKIKEGLNAECFQRSRARSKLELLDKLDNSCEINLPQIMIDQEFAQLWKNFKNTPKSEDKPEHELKDYYLKIAKRRVKLAILFAEMAKKYSVTVTEQDLVETIKAQAMANPAIAKEIIKFYTENKSGIESIKGAIVEEKVVQHILDEAKITEKLITVKELLELE